MAEIKEFLALIQGLAVPLLTLIVVVLNGIRTDMLKLNDKLIELETWRNQHTLHDDEREGRNRENHGEIWREMQRIRDRVDGVRPQ